MCSNSPCGKKKRDFQKVVIPRGMINPHETTVIEIPTNLQKQPVVVAKRKTDGAYTPTKSRSGTNTKPDRFRTKQTSSPVSTKKMQISLLLIVYNCLTFQVSMYDHGSTSRSYLHFKQTEG